MPVVVLVGVLLLLAPSIAGPYDEPPGGCGAPADFDLDPPRPLPKPRPKAPPPAPPTPADDDAADEEMQRQLYEKESAAYFSSEQDWDDFEREHAQEKFIRDFIQQAAAALTMGFVFWLLWARFQQLRQGAAPQAAGTETAADAAAAPKSSGDQQSASGEAPAAEPHKKEDQKEGPKEDQKEDKKEDQKEDQMEDKKEKVAAGTAKEKDN